MKDVRYYFVDNITDPVDTDFENYYHLNDYEFVIWIYQFNDYWNYDYEKLLDFR